MIAPPTQRANPALIGHTEAERILHRAAISGRLHHAWLLTGPEGVGKATLAFRFARALLADLPGAGLEVPSSHPVFAQVAAGTHPDLVTVARAWDEKKQRTKAEVPIEDTRALLDLFTMTPAAGGWRIVVVIGVESLNRNAANALLKLLEEPPARAVFLLTSAVPARVVGTIRSRCTLLKLRPLDEGAMRVAMRGLFSDIADDRLSSLIGASEGSPGRAVRRNLGADGADDLARTQSLLHRTLLDAVSREDSSAAAIEERCEDWSTVLALTSAADRFNLDRQHLAFETMRRLDR